MTGNAVVPIPGARFITGRIPSLSLRYVCMRMPIWRRLLMSFVAFALSRALLRDGMRIAASPIMIAITTSTSIRVKALSTGGGELLVMILGLGAHDIALGR